MTDELRINFAVICCAFALGVIVNVQAAGILMFVVGTSYLFVIGGTFFHKAYNNERQ